MGVRDLYSRWFGQRTNENGSKAVKTTKLKLPFSSREFLISGPSADRSIIGALEANAGYYERHVMSTLASRIKPGATCIDIGANLGVLSICLSTIVGEKGKVYSFEPSVNNFKFMNLNIKQNKISNVFPVNFGIYDEATDLNFSYVEHVAGCSFINIKEVKEGVNEVISCVKFDDWVLAQDIPKIDFIKLDVEGAEIKALRGAKETLRKFKPDLCIEFNPTPMQRFFSADPEELYGILKSTFKHIYFLLDKSNESHIEIQSYPQLNELVKQGKGWEDLYCTF